MKVNYLLIVLLLVTGNSFGQKASRFKISNKFHVEGDGSWDYLSIDEATKYLYISHGTQVNVLDVTSGKFIGIIPDTKGVHGIALVSNLNKGFISNGRDSSVTVFDTRDLKVIEKIRISGKNPDAIIYDPFSQKIFTFNGRSANATVIDPKSNKEIGTIHFEGKPEAAVSDENGKIYVNIEDKSLISVIDAVNMKVLHSWPLAPGTEPSGLAFDKKTQRLFSVCDNKLMLVVDAQNGKVITTLLIGERVDGAAFDPEKKLIYSSNGEGTLTVIAEESANSYKVIETLPTQVGARTIALDYKTHKIYLPTAEYGPAPEPTKENPRPRPTIKPGTFTILEIEPIE
ncbi:MAG: YncE family protein [Bacteroidota bacterium]